jgi:hypothetical protein
MSLKLGVNVTTAISCNFYKFSAKKVAFFLKTNVVIQNVCKNWQCFEQKRQFGRQFFGENIFIVVTSAPGFQLDDTLPKDI